MRRASSRKEREVNAGQFLVARADENVLDHVDAMTFDEHDQLKFQPFGERLYNFLITERGFVEGSFVLSLEGAFGAGKTTFLAMWKNWLDEKRLVGEPVPVVVSLNAWESDIGEDPVLAIVSDFAAEITKAAGKGAKKTADKLKESAGQVGRMFLSLANDVVGKGLGIDAIKAGEYAKGEIELDGRKEAGFAVFRVFEARKQAFLELRAQIRSLVGEGELKFLLLVDELDRCKPNYSIQFLEALKHLFDESGMAVILAVDRNQLKASAQAAFGQNLNFDEYYRKFFHRCVQLPLIDHQVSPAFARSLVKRFLVSDDLAEKARFSFAKFDNDRIGDLSRLLVSFKLTPRQSIEVCRILAHVFAMPNPGAGMIWIWLLASMFMACLNVADRSLFHQVGTRQLTVAAFGEVLVKLGFPRRKEHKRDVQWIVIFLLAYHEGKGFDEIDSFLIDARLVPAGTKTVPEEYGSLLGAFDRDSYDEAVTSKIYAIIENLEQFHTAR